MRLLLQAYSQILAYASTEVQLELLRSISNAVPLTGKA
jgi:hypothetical protein